MQNGTTQICSNMCYPTPWKDTEKIWKRYEKHMKMIQKRYKKYIKKIQKHIKNMQHVTMLRVARIHQSKSHAPIGYLYNSPPEQILTWTIPQHCPWGQVGGWGSPGGGGLHHSGGGGGSRLGVPGGWLHAWGRVWQPSRLGGTPPKQGVLGLVCLLHTHRACSPIMARTNR